MRSSRKVGAESRRISRYETAKLTPSIPALVRLAEALDTSIDYLVIDDAPRRPLQGAELHLAEGIIELGQLDDTDRQAVLRIIEGLIAKTGSMSLTRLRGHPILGETPEEGALRGPSEQVPAGVPA